MKYKEQRRLEEQHGVRQAVAAVVTMVQSHLVVVLCVETSVSRTETVHCHCLEKGAMAHSQWAGASQLQQLLVLMVPLQQRRVACAVDAHP